MRLVLPIEVRVGTGWGGDVHAGSSSRWVAKARLEIEDERVQNSSWGDCWELLRVAASSNPAVELTCAKSRAVSSLLR